MTGTQHYAGGEDRRRGLPEGTPAGEGLYVISVAARLLDMHPQTLRKYERVGLVRPVRTEGNGRLYSQEDMARLRLIKHLVEQGLNLAGVRLALAIMGALGRLRRQAGELEGEALRDLVDRSVGEVFELLHGSWNNE